VLRDMAEAIFWSALATATLLIGMWLAYRDLVSATWTALIMAFGAGAIISAAAYQLVLGAVVVESGRFVVIGVGMALGALTFYFADRWVDGLGGRDRLDFDGAQAGGSGVGILLGSLLDGVPESLVLGLSLVHSPQVSLAFIFAVAISNVPQGLGGTAGMLAAGWARLRITQLWLSVCGLSIVAAVAGYALATLVPGLTGGFFDSFAAGALLVMLTDTMIPESFEHGGAATGLALVFGFGVATTMALLQVGAFTITPI
jgi:ZIP family zinc transporter